MSSPAPPINWSLPLPPEIVSLPLPPTRRSSPLPPINVLPGSLGGIGGASTLSANTSDTDAPLKSVAVIWMLKVPFVAGVPDSVRVFGLKLSHAGNGSPLERRAVTLKLSPASTSANILLGTTRLKGEPATVF